MHRSMCPEPARGTRKSWRLRPNMKWRTAWRPLLQATRRIFPTAQWIKVYLDVDGDISEDYIVFDVQVALELSEARSARWRWNEEFVRICTSRKVGTVCLLLDLRAFLEGAERQR
jgi:hypothetical protein